MAIPLKTRTFINDTYGFTVHLLWPVTPLQFRDYVRQIKPKYVDPGKFVAICYTADEDVIIGFKKWEGSSFDLGTLAHELYHATFRALAKRGIDPCDETEEAFGYLMGSLFENCLRKLNDRTNTKR